MDEVCGGCLNVVTASCGLARLRQLRNDVTRTQQGPASFGGDGGKENE